MEQINTQSNRNISSNTPYYTLKKQIIIQDTGLFKLKNFDKSNIVFTASDPKCIALVDKQFTRIKKYYYQDKPLALDVIELGAEKFVAVGCNKGNIYVTSFKEIEKQGDTQMKEQIELKQQWNLKPLYKQQIFINEIIHHRNSSNILINCYNNGNVALWGLVTGKRLHTFEYLHEKYTYKLRLQKDNILVSCGNDCSAIRTDLDQLKSVSIFHHPLPVWCAQPLNDNEIATVGLFGRVLIWDARSNRIVQACNNDSHQTSFITAKVPGDLRLFYGDTNLLIKWDRRQAKPDLISRHLMNISSQCMLFDQDKLYVCGRGKDLCLLQGSQTLDQLTHMQEASRTLVQKLGVSTNTNSLDIQQSQESQWSQGDDQDQWYDQSQSEMINQSKPLIKKSNQKSKKAKIQAVAKLTIQQLLYFKQLQLRWIDQQPEKQLEEYQQQKMIEKTSINDINKRIQNQGIQNNKNIDNKIDIEQNQQNLQKKITNNQQNQKDKAQKNIKSIQNQKQQQLKQYNEKSNLNIIQQVRATQQNLQKQ